MALSVNSFGTRGITNNCGWAKIPTAQLVGDAYGAMEFLAAQPFVDAKNISAVGFSMGATTVLSLAQDDWAFRVDTTGKSKLKAAVSMYPRCGQVDRSSITLMAPLQIIIGELDDWTPVSECQLLSKHVSPEGASLTLTVLPGAYHAFDHFTYNGRPLGRRVVQGHVHEPNEGANSKAISIIRRNLANNLSN